MQRQGPPAYGLLLEIPTNGNRQVRAGLLQDFACVCDRKWLNVPGIGMLGTRASRNYFIFGYEACFFLISPFDGTD